MTPPLVLIRRRAARWLSAARPIARLLRPAYHQWQSLRYRRLLQRNRMLKDRFPGRRCWVLGTGVSVDEVDFAALSNEYVFACNLLAKHRDFDRLKVSFYAVPPPPPALHADPSALEPAQYAVYAPPDGVVIHPGNAETALGNLFSETTAGHSSVDEVRRGPFHFFSAVEKACPDPETIWFLNARGHRYFEVEGLFRDRRVHYVLKARPSAAPVYDLAQPTSCVDNAVTFAITAAIYMGFTDIVLCGCGYTYEPRQEFHFYDTPVLSTDFSEREALRWSRRLAESRRVELHSLSRAADGYRPMFISRQPVAEAHRNIHGFARSQGVTILNLTPEGFDSPIYPAIRWPQLQETLRGCAPRERAVV